MDKINPLLYITDTDPVPEEVLDASGWFETEYITMSFVRVDTPTSATISGGENLAWFLAQGWCEYDRTYTHRGFDRTAEVSTSAQNITVYLRRRKMQSELVLNDMLREFTEAYNEGRDLNDQRYDELVNLYSVMLDKTEDELNSVSLDPSDYENLIALLTSDFNTFDTAADGALDTYGTSQRARVKLQFDNESADAKQSLVSRGMYNTTVWTSVSSGVERRRAESLNDLEDKILIQQTALLQSSYDRGVHVRTAVMDAHARLLALRKDSVFSPTEIRNTVLSTMLNFMERRTDEYPGLDSLAGIAAQLGYGEGGTVVSP